MEVKANRYYPLRAAHVVLAVVSFVLSFVPFSGIGASPQVKRSQPAQTEWMWQRRAVAYHRVAHYACSGLTVSKSLSSYSLYGDQYHTRLAALTIAACAQRHAPPMVHVFSKIITTSDHEDPLLNHSFLA